MNDIDLLINRLQTARGWTVGLLEDVEPELWFKPPAPGVQHVAWQVGHLATSRVALVFVRCLDLEHTDYVSAAFRDQFGKGSTPVNDASVYPSISDIRATYDRVHEQCLELVRGIDPAMLDEKVSGGPHPLFVTKQQCILTAAMHETFHAGQIALTRRLFGKKALR